MNLTPGLISSHWLWASWVFYLIATLYSCWRAPWHKLTETDSANIYFGAIVALLIFWNLKGGIYPGQTFHFLGATALYLMFNWPFAIIATQLITLAITLNGQGGWETFAINVLIMGIIPISIAHLIRYLTQTHLPHNFFTYIFINTFFAAALGIILSGLTTYIVLSSSAVYSIDDLNQQLFPVYLLLSLPEALLNGSAITLMVVYRPNWIATFYDKTYLSN